MLERSYFSGKVGWCVSSKVCCALLRQFLSNPSTSWVSGVCYRLQQMWERRSLSLSCLRESSVSLNLPYFLDHSPSKKFCGMPAQCSTCPPRNALYQETWPSISTLPGTGKVYQRGPPNDAYQQPQWHIPICLTSSCVKHSFRAWTLRIRLRRLVAQLTSPTIRYGH